MTKCRFCDRTGRFYRDEPEGYLQWHAWAERMSKTHHQQECPGCGRFTIWRKGVLREVANG